MSNSTARWVCADASFVVPLVTRPHGDSSYPKLWRQWLGTGLRPAAPTVVCYEVANALYRYVAHRALLRDEVAAALDAALDLGIPWFGDAELHQRALQTAREQSLPAVYDALYLALTERLNAEL
jgi:predicted nucleic acid-binding protein